MDLSTVVGSRQSIRDLLGQADGTEHSRTLDIALAFATTFQGAIAAARDDEKELVRIATEYRDFILSIHELATDSAVGYEDQLAKIVPLSVRQDASHAEAQRWKHLDHITQAAETSLASKSREERFRRKKTRDLIAIVAAWGFEVVNQYGWAVLNHEMVAAIVPVTKRLPSWSDARRMLNAVMLDRHCGRLIDGKQTQLVIGQHPAQGLNRAICSPLTKRDFRALEEYLDKGEAPGDDARIDEILNAPRGWNLETLGLTSDKHGLLVPNSKSPLVKLKTMEKRGPDLGAHRSGTKVSPNLKQHPNRRTSQFGRFLAMQEAWNETVSRAGNSIPQSTGEPHELPDCLKNLGSDTPQRNEREDTREPQRSKSTPVQKKKRRRSPDQAEDRAPNPGICTRRPRMTNASDRDSITGPKTLGREVEEVGGDSSSSSENGDETDRDRCDGSELGFRNIGHEEPSTGVVVEVTSESNVSTSHILASPNRVRGTDVSSRTASSSSPNTHDEVTPDKTNEGAAHRPKKYFDLIFSEVRDSFLEQLQADVPVGDLQREVEYLQELVWASAYADPCLIAGKTLQDLGLEDTEEAADVLILDVATFEARLLETKVIDGEQRYAWVPRKPLIIKNDHVPAFDPDNFTPERFATELSLRSNHNSTIDVRDSKLSSKTAVTVKDYIRFLMRYGHNGPHDTAEMSNAINMRPVFNCPVPRFIQIRRLRLLEFLVNRTQGTPGKREERRANDISDSLVFALHGLRGAFSGPHCDALGGTYVRVLSGHRFWTVCPHMTQKDSEQFRSEGSEWFAKNGKTIGLQAGDILVMPGPIVHTVMMPTPSYAEGGMFWDCGDALTPLRNLQWLASNQVCTNEATQFELAPILSELEVLVAEHPDLFQPGDAGRIVEEVAQIRLCASCSCDKKCGKTTCPCAQNSRRCTALCTSHPSLPPINARDICHSCMMDPLINGNL